MALLAACLALAPISGAAAQDPEAGLVEAEARAADAKAEVQELEAAVRPAAASFEAAEERAAPIRAQVQEASSQLEEIEAALKREHARAVATVERASGERAHAEDQHENTVAVGIGLAIAALVVACIALAWGWFRASAAVAYLARIELGQAIGLCVGSGFLAVAVGAVVASASGVASSVGFAIVGLGLVLPAAFLLGRHSAEVQRGRAMAYLRRERLPARATQAIATLFGLFFVACLAGALFAGEAESDEVSAELLRAAETSEPSSRALIAAESKVDRLESKASTMLTVVRGKKSDLRAARRQLARAEAVLEDATNDERRFERGLVAIEKRETREREQEERRAEERLEAEREREEEALAEACDENYSGCLDPNAVDYDCSGGSGDGPLYTGTVEVLGVDHYGLDDDGDGIGCDP